MRTDNASSAYRIETTRQSHTIRPQSLLLSKYLVPPGTLLVSWSASLGVFEWREPDTALLNQHIFKVVPHNDKVVQNYLKHILEGALIDMEKYHRGSTMKHVNRGEFLGIKIPLPPIVQQKRIAAILDQADALRRLRKRATDRLRSLEQAIFQEMFGDPNFNSKSWPLKSFGQCAEN